MAICRCREHSPPTKGKHLAGYVRPFGYPNTSTICGRVGCRNVAWVWLSDSEEALYHQGEIVFIIPSDAAKVQIELDSFIPIDSNNL